MQWLGLRKQLHVYFLFLTQLFALSNIANSGDVIKMRNRKGSKYYILEAINKHVHHSHIFDESIEIRNKITRFFDVLFFPFQTASHKLHDFLQFVFMYLTWFFLDAVSLFSPGAATCFLIFAASSWALIHLD